MGKLGEPLDMDTVPDMVSVDTEVTDLDTVSGRDPLMPIPKLGEPLDTDTVPDTVLVDMEVTVLALPAMEVTDLDMDTESNFHISNNVLPFTLISSHHTY